MLEKIQIVFTTIYTLEAIIKIVADGFLIGKDTYLRDPTNVFDFVVIIGSYTKLIVSRYSLHNKKAESFFRILRTIRVCKLFAGFKKIPMLRK